MKRKGLSSYLLLSFLIHAGFILGAHNYLRLPAETEPADLIPVEIVILTEEFPTSQPRLALNERITQQNVLETKARALTRLESKETTDDSPIPPPKVSADEPVLRVDEVITVASLPHTPMGERTARRPPVPDPALTGLKAPGFQARSYFLL